MISPQDFERLLPKVVHWVREVEAAILLLGEPLPPEPKADAIAIGINRADDVRLIVRSQMLLPIDAELGDLATATGLINQGTAGMAFGHGIILKFGAITRKLIAHELVHVKQYETRLGIENFLREYLHEILPPSRYGEGPMVQEAVKVASRIYGG
jgi:hypothetical protein